MLVRMKIFTTQKLDTETHKSSDDDVLHGLTPFSSMLLHDADITLAPYVLMENYPALSSPWHYLSDVVKEGGSGFKKANGVEVFEMAGKDPGLKKVITDFISCTTKILFKGMFSNNGRNILLERADEDCTKILKNCRNAINKETGKVIIIGKILKEDEEGNEGHFGNIDVIQDLTMMVHTVGGKQRTENEWKKILKEAGFSRYNVIELNYLYSLIEAYPK
ncbi:hypothetical protein Leryth_016467 [Lithospermum erythrorhizon]|nr:hypothetical protein Leryth_016467 [Lithospermum erythrorhizon]